jgi:hypothetical protein
MARFTLAALAAAALVLIQPTDGIAQAMEGGGYVVYVPSHDQATELPDGRLRTSNALKGVVIADDAENPFHLMSQDCAGTGLATADGMPIRTAGYCAGRDDDGNMWWLSYWNDAEGGTWTILGGTGTFEGMEGGGTTRVEALDPDGRFTIRWQGSWTMGSMDD